MRDGGGEALRGTYRKTFLALQLHVSQGCPRHTARGAATLYLVVLRKAIEVLAEYPDDVAVKHRLPR